MNYYAYDVLGRLKQEKLLSNVNSVYQYDANGNRKLQQFNTPYGTTSDTYSYVLVSNILKTLTDSAANSFSYDAVGNLIQDNQFTYGFTKGLGF